MHTKFGRKSTSQSFSISRDEPHAERARVVEAFEPRWYLGYEQACRDGMTGPRSTLQEAGWLATTAANAYLTRPPPVPRSHLWVPSRREQNREEMKKDNNRELAEERARRSYSRKDVMLPSGDDENALTGYDERQKALEHAGVAPAYRGPSADWIPVQSRSHFGKVFWFSTVTKKARWSMPHRSAKEGDAAHVMPALGMSPVQRRQSRIRRAKIDRASRIQAGAATEAQLEERGSNMLHFREIKVHGKDVRMQMRYTSAEDGSVNETLRGIAYCQS
eukprot:g2228.t1